MLCSVSDVPLPEASTRLFDPLRSVFKVASIYSQFGRGWQRSRRLWITINRHAEQLHRCMPKSKKPLVVLSSIRKPKKWVKVWFIRVNIGDNRPHKIKFRRQWGYASRKIVIDYEVKITSNTRDTHPKHRGQSNVTSSPRSSKAAQCLKCL